MRSQRPRSVNFGSLRHVKTLRVEDGGGVAICIAQGIIVTCGSTYSLHHERHATSSSSPRPPCTITAFECMEPFGCLGSWSHLGLNLVSEDGWGSGRMAFTAPGSFETDSKPTLLVADAGNDRVMELDMSTVARVNGAPQVLGFLCEGSGCRPRAVATCATMIAVVGWADAAAGDHFVILFDAKSRKGMRRLGLGHDQGRADGRLLGPLGVCFTNDGAFVVVADSHNDRVVLFRSTGEFVKSLVGRKGEFTDGVLFPADVAEVEDGLIIVDASNDRLVHVRSTAPGIFESR
jgi:hypothetical protein